MASLQFIDGVVIGVNRIYESETKANMTDFKRAYIYIVISLDQTHCLV